LLCEVSIGADQSFFDLHDDFVAGLLDNYSSQMRRLSSENIATLLRLKQGLSAKSTERRTTALLRLRRSARVRINDG
jgi:hypothetical protein